jgi:hypothetical protein
MKHDAINAALRLIFQAIQQLKDAFPNRGFTIDGRFAYRYRLWAGESQLTSTD